LNQPQASDGWLTADALWLVSKTVSDKLRAHLLAQGIDGIPASNTAVFNVLQEHGMLQPTPEGKAIWKATITSDTGWSHSFTLLRLAPALIWETSERPAAFAGTVTVETQTDEADSADTPALTEALPVVAAEPAPATTTDAMNELLSLMESQPATTPETMPTTQAETAPQDAALAPSAEHFIIWLKNALATRKLILNDAKALVHTVDNTAFLVSPGIFQRYAQEHPHTATLAKQENQQDWQWLQKRFEKPQAPQRPEHLDL